MNKYTSAYPVEIEVTFGLDRHQTELIISGLISSQKLTSEIVGDSYRLTIPNTQPTNRHDRKNNTRSTIEHKEVIEA